MKEYSKIIILENENRSDAVRNDTTRCEDAIYAHSFPDAQKETWYRFYYGLFVDDKEASLKRIMDLTDDTLMLTCTTLANSVMSGYGDILRMWTDFFTRLMQLNKRVNICVVTSPEFKWELLKWVTGGSNDTVCSNRATMVRKLLNYHTVYSLEIGEYDFHAGHTRITTEWFNENYYPGGLKVKNNELVICEISSFHIGHRLGPHYTLYVPIPGRPNATTSQDIGLEDLKRLNPRPKRRVKHG